MTTIKSSTQYHLFDITDSNRDIKRTKELTQSFRAHGWIEAYPLHVVSIGGRYKIKAGHHRAFVAEKLGIPLKFVVCNDAATLYELEKSTTHWKVGDYLSSHCRKGNSNYIEVQNYCRDTGVSIQAALALFSGNQMCAGETTLNKFKSGDFEIKDRDLPVIVSGVIDAVKASGVKFYANKALVSAIAKVVLVDSISVKRLIKNIKSSPFLLAHHATVDGFVGMLEEVYNRNAREKVPVAHMAHQLARRRNPLMPPTIKESIQPR